jgi:hypothetical protein
VSRATSQLPRRARASPPFLRPLCLRCVLRAPLLPCLLLYAHAATTCLASCVAAHPRLPAPVPYTGTRTPTISSVSASSLPPTLPRRCLTAPLLRARRRSRSDRGCAAPNGVIDPVGNWDRGHAAGSGAPRAAPAAGAARRIGGRAQTRARGHRRYRRYARASPPRLVCAALLAASWFRGPLRHRSIARWFGLEFVLPAQVGSSGLVSGTVLYCGAKHPKQGAEIGLTLCGADVLWRSCQLGELRLALLSRSCFLACPVPTHL